MTPDERIQALRRFGFTERQTRFLAMVMVHSGVCLQRQYAAFAGIVHGEKTRRFFAKLVQLGLASTYDCAHNRARIYHVRHKALYQAIDETDHRHRRPVPLGRAIERLMILDALLLHRDAAWLATADEKVAHLSVLSRLPAEHMPHVTTTTGMHLFPDKLPIGVQSDGRVVFVYLVGVPDPMAIYHFVYRHAVLLRHLPNWTVQIIVPPHLGYGREHYDEAVRETLHWPFRMSSVEEVRWYFEQRRALEQTRVQPVEIVRFEQVRWAHSAHRFEALYKAWLTDGDAILDTLATPEISYSITRGAGKIETVVLPHQYTHLSPLVAIA
jgi:hypothetical protein